MKEQVLMVCPVCDMTSTLDTDELEQVWLADDVVTCDHCGEGILITVEEQEKMRGES